MGYEAKKTEHAGAKHGSGAYWGRKYDAKKESNKMRRRISKEEIQRQTVLDRDLAISLRQMREGKTRGPFNTGEEFIRALNRDVKKLRSKKKS